MTELAPRVIELTEHETTELAAADLGLEVGEALWHGFGTQIDVDFPSPKTAGRWRMTPKGWVGFIPLSAELGIALRPKVGVRSIFAMLEYAYNLKSFKPLQGLQQCATLEELYGRIAAILARRVRDRVRQGLRRAYEPTDDLLPYVRGRLDTSRLAAAPWRAELPCQFEEHTADVEDNRLLLWALHLAARSGVCSESAARHVVDAHRALHHAVALEEHEARDYCGRRYDRLNDDYAAMHALGRFIVEQAGPRHAQGEQAMVPFLLDMNRLFEQFVAEWLRVHLPDHMSLEQQGHVTFGVGADVRFVADLVLRHRSSGAALCVLDTKYKRDVVPSSDDVAQVVAYASAWGTGEAVLVYPNAHGAGWQAQVGGVRVRALGFELDVEFEPAGSAFLGGLLGQCS